MNEVDRNQMPSDGSGGALPLLAPDIAVEGLSVFRSTVVHRPLSKDGVARPDGLKWHISGAGVGEDLSAFALFGDLEIRHEGWFAAATSVARLTREAGGFGLATEEDADALARVLGPWASHMLYDTAAMTIRTSLAHIFGCPITVPWVTPDPHIAFRARGRVVQE
jgi:hypothetical protein